jgi:hypothetical protein
MTFRQVSSRNGTCWLLVVADGVSTSRRAREAARFVVASLWASAAVIADAPDAATALRTEILRVHGATRARLGGSGLASVVAVVVLPEQRRLVHASVGDSLVCISNGGVFKQVNTEDRVIRVRRLNSEPVLIDGCPLIDRGISQGIGIDGSVMPHMGVIEGLDEGALICVASDGVNAVRLGGFLRETGEMPALDTIREFCLDEMRQKGDDTTLLVARMSKAVFLQKLERSLLEYPGMPSADRDATLRVAEGSQWLPSCVLVHAVECEDQEDRGLRLASLLARSSPRLSGRELIPLLEFAIAQRRSRIAILLRNLISICR